MNPSKGGFNGGLDGENDRHSDNSYKLQWAECGADEPMARLLGPVDARHRQPFHPLLLLLCGSAG